MAKASFANRHNDPAYYLSRQYEHIQILSSRATGKNRNTIGGIYFANPYARKYLNAYDDYFRVDNCADCWR
jgi:hypothetical protein